MPSAGGGLSASRIWALIGRAASDARFDLVELGNPPQRLGGDWRAGGVTEVKELASGMRPKGELHRPRPAAPRPTP
jgi:hypothetical protein